MDSIKEIFKICNKSLWYDYTSQQNKCEFNHIREGLIKYFYNDIPGERLIISLNIIDDIILKIYNNESNDIIKNINKLREQILYMLSFQKTVKEDEQEID